MSTPEVHELDKRITVIEHAAEEQAQSLREIATELHRANDELSKTTTRLASISHEDHSRHHALWEEELQAKKARRQFWQSVAQRVASGGIWAAITAVGAVIWWAATHYFKTT